VQIKSDYVLAWNPSPAEMVSRKTDKQKIKTAVRNAFNIAGEFNNIIDVVLKGVQTVSGNVYAIHEFVNYVREVINEGG